MPVLHLVKESSAPPAAVWSVLADFAGYGSWMPLTRMRTDDGMPHPGWGFAGVSGLGPVAFTDSMVVTEWVPPTGGEPGTVGSAGRFRVVKTGWLLGGWAQAQVVPLGSGSRVEWDQRLSVRPLPALGPVESVTASTSRWLYSRALDAMMAAAEARAETAAAQDAAAAGRDVSTGDLP
jgi:hypothetical protein